MDIALHESDTRLASARHGAASSVDQQVKEELSAVRDFLAGRTSEANGLEAVDKAMRQVVAEELLAAISRADAKESSGPGDVVGSGDLDAMAPAHGAGVLVEQQQPRPAHHEEQQRARQLFMDHGYFEEAVQDLRSAPSPQQRAAAARSLGVVGSKRGTPHLIAAMFDDDQEVRSAAEQALAQMGDLTASNFPVNPRLGGDLDLEKSKVADALSSDQKTLVGEVASRESGGPAKSARDAIGSGNEDDAVSPKSPVRDHRARVPGMIETGSGKSRVNASEIRVQQETQEMVQHESNQETEEASQEMFQSTTIDDATASKVEEQLLSEERAIREKIKQLERQSIDAGAARTELEKEVLVSVERETRLRAEAAIRRREEEELRKRADEEAERRRSQERDAVRAEQLARSSAETEAQRLAEEEARMRLETFNLQQAAEELAWQRIGVETARREAAEAARLAEATRSRQEAKSRHEAEVARLSSEEEALREAAEQVVRQRAEVGAAHQEAEAEMERLTKERVQLSAAEAASRAETQRIREAEERNRAYHEKLRLELEGLRLVAQEVATRRAEAQEEQQRLEGEVRLFDEHEEQRRVELDLLRKNAEIVAQQRAEEEKQIRSQVDSLRIADAEARKRIEEAEARRRKLEDVYRLVAEKVQRVEAEAHLRAVEEEQILAKLEAVRRNAADEAQTRTEQEKRIKEDIDLFRRLEDVERPRMEVAALQRSQAQGLFQQVRDRAKADEQTRSRAEEQLDVVDARQQPKADEGPGNHYSLDPSGEPEQAVENPGAGRSLATEGASAVSPAAVEPQQGAISPEDRSAPGVTAAIQTYLKSVDPYKRAAAVSELARSNAKDAFDLITNCFDDHSPHVRNAAARALPKLEPTRTVDLFNRALEAGSAQRRRNIGSAIADSGLATEAIENLVSENREDTYNALSMLFVMAKTGEVQPLVQAIQEHSNGEISEAAIKLLTLSGHSEIANAALKRRVNGGAGQ